MESIIFVKELKGFSGCKIGLYLKGEKPFVRKTSSSVEYNERLKKQMEKQKFFFENLKNEEISTPEIYDSGYEKSGLFFFDMEYIPSITLIEYISKSSTEELNKIAEVLMKIMKIMKEKRLKNKIDLTSKIRSKIDEIDKKVIGLSEKVNIFDIKEIIFPELIETLCHGDLTFENILYNEKNKKYYLIDFLDSFIEHYWMDIIKMFQDIEGEWYLIRNPDINKKQMEVKMGFISAYIKKNFKGEYWKYHYPLLKLTFARILPYAKGEDFNQVVKRIKSLPNFP